MGRYSVIGNNILDKQGLLNIIKNYVFGSDTTLSLYDQNKTYNMGDKAYIIDTLTGNVKVVTAIMDGITGPYDPSKWNDMTLSDTIETGLDDVVVISKKQPTERVVQVWFAPIQYSTHYVIQPEENPDIPAGVSDVDMIFYANAVPMVEDTSTADLSNLVPGDIVFDWEGEGEYISVTPPSPDEKINLIVDEQDDVLVHDDPPEPDDPAFIWIDTDLTDDIP